MHHMEREEDMSALELVWEFMRLAFNLVANLLAEMGLGTYGGKAMAALLFASFFFIAGAVRRLRRIVGPALAVILVLFVLIYFLS